MSTTTLERRVARLEAAAGDDDVTWEELVRWSYIRDPLSPERQREFAEFERRETSALCLLIKETVERARAWEQARHRRI